MRIECLDNAIARVSYANVHSSTTGARICYNGARICYNGARICYISARICYISARICYNSDRICYNSARICYNSDRICYNSDRFWECAKCDTEHPVIYIVYTIIVKQKKRLKG
ncbi:hypothetical protein [Nostoc sp.]|uniref:hypothetical protein n=1 Tax=Nostoc sp. TaxID=1180 RepID=UPI002FF665E2